MSTSQKRSSPSTKSLAIDADRSSSSAAQQEDSNGDMIVDSLSGKDTVDGKHQEQEDKPSNDQHADQTNKDHKDKEDEHEKANENEDEGEEEEEADEDEDEEDEEEDEDEDDYDHHHQTDHDGIFSSGGSMSSMVSGMSSRLKGILANLRTYEDPSLQLIALQDLAVLLSVSTEDTLAGYFSCDSFVKELVLLMRGNGDGDDNPEIMLLACRCLSNLMEAMPAALGSIVYGGAVSVLCSKLIEIQYIDLAEQSLTTLEKISSEYPHAVVKEGGLAAVLMFLDFFSTNVQRTAVKTAANCCRGLHQESISMVQDILPNLENILQYTDQKIVEQACLCFVRLADSFKFNATHLQASVNVDEQLLYIQLLYMLTLRSTFKNKQTIITETVLRGILSLLSPNANVVVGPHVYTLLLHFLSTVAEHSPTLGFALLEMDVVDMLFLIVTGTPAPLSSGDDNSALKVPNVGSRSKEQISEIISIVIELLPSLPKDDALFDTEYKHRALKKEETNVDSQESVSGDNDQAPASRAQNVDKRRELLASHPERVHRLGRILIPTLIEVYSSTVHLKVRQRAIHALVKLVYFTDDAVLKTVLKNVELAGFLAVILSQQEHQSLVVAALQICDILMTKLPSLYRFYFEREGVTFEISKLAYLGVESSLSKESKNIKATDQLEETATNKGSDSDAAIEVAAKEESPKSSEPEPMMDTKSTSTSTSTGTSTSTNNGTAEDVSLTTLEPGQRLLRLMAELRSMRDQPEGAGTINEQLDAIESELEAAWARSSLAEHRDSSTPAPSSTAPGSTLFQLRTLQRFITGESRSVITAQKDERGLGSGRTKNWIFERTRILVEALQTPEEVGENGNHHGTTVLAELKKMADGLKGPADVASKSVKELAEYFTQQGTTGISSFEFLNSGLPHALLGYLTDTKGSYASSHEERMRIFIQEFMTSVRKNGTKDTVSGEAPFGLLVKKMQEALTRMETFEVEAAQASMGDGRSHPSSSLATQVRLRLSPEEGTEVPSGYQNLVVSIHAIATFRTLDEYLRPRLKPKLSTPETTSGKPKPSKEDSVPKEMNSSISAEDSAPVARRSSRLQRLADAALEDNITKDAKKEPLAVKNQNDAERNHSEDSSEDSDEGDVEEMDYDVEAKDGTQNTKGMETSSIDLESEKVSDSMAPSTDRSAKDHMAENGRRSLKSGAPSTRKDHGANASESSASWHIQFSMHGMPIATDTTVYGAIHEYERKSGKGGAPRSMWSSLYPIKYKRVDTPPPGHSIASAYSQPQAVVDLTFTPEMPKDLPQEAEYAPILGLLRVLHGVNDDWRRFYPAEDRHPEGTVQRLEPKEFISSKISAKVNRQLEEPLIVASSCLPGWTIGLVTGFPFLFPFDTRYTYLQSTAFGFSRSIMRWQNQQQRNGHTDHRDDSQTFLGRIQRQKVRISRQKALESAVRVMDLYGSNQAMLEVEYFDEVGTGLGPTLEFYSVVSKEFCKKSLKLWRDADAGSDAQTEYVSAPRGLYPRPMAHFRDQSDNEKKILKLFKTLGQFIAKAMLDSRIIDVPLSALFISQLLGRSVTPHLQLISSIDPVLARSLESLQSFVKEKKRIYGLNLPSKDRENALKNVELQGSKLEDMSLDFTLAGYPEIELKSGGINIPVTIYNVEEYIQLTVDMTVGRGIEAQVAAFKDGFNCVFAIQDLVGFRSEELVTLFGSGDEDWSFETLLDSVKADHGFRTESRAFKNLLQVMSEFNKEERRKFLQFITGSPKLPIGGFKNLHPPFTVVCKPFEAPLKADDYLPSVMTCANYLKMPDYSCKEITLKKFMIAYEEGQGSFHLS
ncbi:Ubiquitin fusion degradation protein 4 [Haplosporangium sp. Z 11]|nr:Ubiquitin fusion degradation protein 4 [Haplosporangium sp. Z 11]